MNIDNLTLLRMKLAARDIDNRLLDPVSLAPADVLEIDASNNWAKAAEVAQSEAWRWAGV